MIVTTTEVIVGRKIKRTLGLVRGNTIRARHIGRDITALLRNVVGGEISEYTKLFAESREQALDRMIAEARSLNADAVIALRYSTMGCIVVPVALGLDFTVEKLRGTRRREGAYAIRAAVLPAFLCLAMWGTAFWAGGVATAARDAKPVHHFFLPFLQSPTPPIKHRGLLRAAEVVKANSGPDDVIMITGMLMSSELPFYAERRAVMISSLIDNCTEPVWAEVRKSRIAVYVDYFDERTHPNARDAGCRYAGRDEQCLIAQIEGFWIGSCYRDQFDDYRD